ncbi:MAG: CDGSH iron-sulfur domain-containing protein [Heliobacteriaceae bacterium]|jgi:CDGSH-type Zn-finger protein|nr:CDGSH iron-sulfur domain-containing protein [Heliobacteriaceae bacterium]
MAEKEVYIKVTKDGPYMVYGMPEVSQKVILIDENGISVKYGNGKVFEIKSDPVALCRCGKSQNAPFCDGAHAVTGFRGTETAGFDPILYDAEKIEGPNLDLYDNENYCAYARFCDAHGRVWNLIGVGQPKTDEYAIKEANACPAGRLLVFDKEGNMLEEPLPKSIAVLEDSGLEISGPLWVRGGIRVESADGQSYEVRNRQTLCRCGVSSNKPFCNGAHASLKFKAKYK